MSRLLICPVAFLALAYLADPVQLIAVATAPVKCCDDGLVLSDDFDQCVQAEDAPDEAVYRRVLKEFDFTANYSRPRTCLQESNNTTPDEDHPTITSNAFASCIDFQKNGSLIYLECWNISRKHVKDQCGSIFSFIYIYGAKMMVFANIIYLFVYTPVVLVYIVIPGVCRRAYDKIVLTFVFTQILLSSVVIAIGHFMLCHKPIGRTATTWLGLTLAALTIASCILLLLISFDVASTITTFRWAPSSGTKGRDENHKFRVYVLWIFIGTIVPTGISTVLQFSPLPDENIFHPNYHKMTVVNIKALIHSAIVPVSVAIASNVLFIYTTVKMINIQRSTNLANENRRASVKKKYVLYLKLYLLMDAPYVTGALGSSYEDLWILKFGRVVQPIFLCLAVIPRGTITNLFLCKKKPPDIRQVAAKNGR